MQQIRKQLLHKHSFNMVSSTTMTRDISTILFLILSMSGTVFGLPLGATDGENTDGQIAQPDGQQMFPADMPPPPPGAFNDPGVLPSNELPGPPSGGVLPPSNNGQGGDSPVEAAEVAGTGLAMMAGPVMPMVPSGNTGDMFPDNMPAPPPGAVNDEVPQAGQVVPPSNGNMFPDNMPAPPPSAVNDEVPQTGQVVPPSNGNTFPDNMPAPPLGAMNNEVPQTGQVVSPNNDNMFPDNMPPPPPGAVNDGVEPLPEQEIAPRENDVNLENLEILNKDTVPQYRGMFPPNMPPPPPGAFNEPPPVPKFSEEKPNEQTVPLDGAVVEPVYVAGMNVPDAAAVPPSEQNPFIDPNQGPPFPSSKQDAVTANEPSKTPQYNPDNPVSSDQNTPYGQTSGNPQALVPNTNENPEEVQAPYNPNDLGGVNNPMPSQNNPPAESVPNQNKAPVPIYPNIPDTNPNPTAELVPNPNLPTDSADTDVGRQESDNLNNNPSESQLETSYEPSYESSYEEVPNNVNENPQGWSQETFSEEGSDSVWEESESDYSFLDLLDSSMDSSDYESVDSITQNGQGFNSFWEDSESEELAEFDSTYSDESSEYSDLDWLFNSIDGSSLGAGGEWSEEEQEGYNFGGDLEEENGGHDAEQQQSLPSGVIDAIEQENDLYRTGGTSLIIYCIPAIILSVLVILAWKNYRGKIRVVGVSSVDAKQYDWKSNRSSEEHAPMLLDQDQEEKEY